MRLCITIQLLLLLFSVANAAPKASNSPPSTQILAASSPSNFALAPTSSRRAFCAQWSGRSLVYVQDVSTHDGFLLDSLSGECDSPRWIDDDRLVIHTTDSNGQHLLVCKYNGAVLKEIDPAFRGWTRLVVAQPPASLTRRVYFYQAKQPFEKPQLLSFSTDDYSLQNHGNPQQIDEWIIGENGEIEAGVENAPDIMRIWKPAKNGPSSSTWTMLSSYSKQPGEQIILLAGHNGLKGAKLIAYFGNQTPSCMGFDSTTGSFSTSIFGPTESDIIGIGYRPQDGTIVSYTTVNNPIRPQCLDPQYKDFLSKLYRRYGADKSYVVEAATPDFSRTIFSYSGDTTPPVFRYLDEHDRDEVIADLSQGVNPRLFAPMRSFVIRAQDGLILPCFEMASSSLNKTSPVIVVFGGGPFVGEHWGWRPMEQVLATHGVRVIIANYRGARAFGWNLFQAGYGEANGKMLDDILNVMSDISSRYPHASRRVVIGSSFGGYGVIRALSASQMPGFDGVILINPVVDPNDVFSRIPDSTSTLLASQKAQWFGSAAAPCCSLLDLNIGVHMPLILIQGSEDSVVNPQLGAQFVRSLQSQGIEAIYYPLQADHNFSTADSRNRLFATILRLFANIEAHASQIKADTP